MTQHKKITNIQMKKTSNISLLSTKAPKGNYLLAKTRNKNASIEEMMASQHLVSAKKKLKCTNVIG
jgi:hypothetical protein